jgi:hypothetical protein
MNKRLIPWYIFLFSSFFLFVGIYVAYECFRHGVGLGLFMVLLSWSVYTLSVPAAHGRLLIGGLFNLIGGKRVFPEPYLWAIAIVVNLATLLFAPQLYAHTLMTYIFYRALFVPTYWLIFALAALGVWYRSILGYDAYLAGRSTHTMVRHLLTLVGLLVIFYLTHQDFIVLLNVTVSG